MTVTPPGPHSRCQMGTECGHHACAERAGAPGAGLGWCMAPACTVSTQRAQRCVHKAQQCAQSTTVCMQSTTACTQSTTVCTEHNGVHTEHNGVHRKHTSVHTKHNSVHKEHNGVHTKHTSVHTDHNSMHTEHNSVHRTQQCARRAQPLSWPCRSGRRTLCCPHQEFPLLLPVAALRVGAAVRLGHHVDQLPLLCAGAGPVLQGFDHLLLAPPLPVLLDQLPLGYALRVVQHHCGAAISTAPPPALLGAPHCPAAAPGVPICPTARARGPPQPLPQLQKDPPQRPTAPPAVLGTLTFSMATSGTPTCPTACTYPMHPNRTCKRVPQTPVAVHTASSPA